MGLSREGGLKQVAYIPSEFMFMLVDVKAVRTEKVGIQEKSRALDSDTESLRTTAGRKGSHRPYGAGD